MGLFINHAYKMIIGIATFCSPRPMQNGYAYSLGCVDKSKKKHNQTNLFYYFSNQQEVNTSVWTLKATKTQKGGRNKNGNRQT